MVISIMLCLWCAGAAAQGIPMPIGTGNAPATTYWTWNAAYMGAAGALSGGNLTFAVGGTGSSNAVVIATLPGGTTGKNGAKYYYEVTINVAGNNQSIGLENSLAPSLNTWMGNDVHGYGYYTTGTSPGSWLAGSLSFANPPNHPFVSGDVVGILYDGSAYTVTFYLLHSGATTNEGTFSLAGSGAVYYPAMSINGGNSTANFGVGSWLLSGAPFGGSGWVN